MIHCSRKSGVSRSRQDKRTGTSCVYPQASSLLTHHMTLYYQETARFPTIGVRDLSCLEFAPNGCLIAGGGSDGTIGIWDMKCRSLYVFTGPSSVLSLAWSPCGPLYAGLENGTILQLAMTVSPIY